MFVNSKSPQRSHSLPEVGFFSGNELTAAAEGGFPGQHATVVEVILADDGEFHIAGRLAGREALDEVLDEAGGGTLLEFEEYLDLAGRSARGDGPQDGVIDAEPGGLLLQADCPIQAALFFTADDRVFDGVGPQVEHPELFNHQGLFGGGAGTEHEEQQKQWPTVHARYSSRPLREFNSKTEIRQNSRLDKPRIPGSTRTPKLDNTRGKMNHG